jgi:hypothetical protein
VIWCLLESKIKTAALIGGDRNPVQRLVRAAIAIVSLSLALNIARRRHVQQRQRASLHLSPMKMGRRGFFQFLGFPGAEINGEDDERLQVR